MPQPRLINGLSVSQALQRLRDARRPHRDRLHRAADLLLSQSPDRARRIVAQAREAMEGVVRLPGRDRAFFVGQPPRWHEPFFNNQQISGVHRFIHLPPLLQAWRLTGDPTFAHFAADQVDHWIEHCPLPDLVDEEDDVKAKFTGDVPWNCVQASNRASGAIWPLIDCLACEPLLDEARWERWLGSLHDHARMLAFTTPWLSTPAGNHYLMYSLGLLAAATLGRDLADAKGWIDLAVERLEACGREQIHEDGAQSEATPGYHSVCVSLLSSGQAMLAQIGRSYAPDVARRLEQAVLHSLHASRPTGGCTPIGDANPDDTYLGALLGAFQARGDVKPLAAATRLRGLTFIRNFILAADSPLSDPQSTLDALERELAAAPVTDYPRAWRQRQVKQVALRNNWTRDAFYLYLNCQTVKPNGHSDLDPCGFDFCALGQPLLVDPGRVEYRESDQRRRFRSATYHNTITVDFREPYDYRSQWFKSPQKETGIEFVQDEPGLLAVGCWQKNYEPVLHRRALILLDDALLLVLDGLTTIEWSQSVQLHFHFATPQVSLDEFTKTATSENGPVRLLVRGDAALEAELLPGEIAPRMGRAYPSVRLRLSDYRMVAADHREYATVADPYLVDQGAPVVETPTIQRDANAAAAEPVYDVRCQVNDQPIHLRWTAQGVERIRPAQ